MTSIVSELAASPRLRRGLAVAVVALHVLVIAAPLDVLYPVDPWEVGRRVWRGDVPYRDFGFEYPPLAIVPFLVAGAGPSGLALPLLALQALAAEVAVVVLVLRKHAGAVLRYGVLSLLVFPFLSGGFDAYPMLAIALSTTLLVHGRAAGWWMAAAGLVVKLSPGAAWVWARRPLVAGLAAMVVAVAVAFAPLMLADDADDTWVGWTLHRGVQVESVAGTAYWAFERLQGDEPRFEYRFRAWEIHGADTAAAVTLVAAALGLVVVAVARPGRQPWLAALATVLLLLAGSKVLSPQFVAWGAPLAAVVGGRWFGGYLALAGLTTAAYAAGTGPSSVLAVTLLRNVVLVVLVVAALRQLLDPRPDLVDPDAEIIERP